MILGSIRFISGFELNKQSLLKEKLKLRAAFSRKNAITLELVLPPMVPDKDIVAPLHTTNAALKLIALSCNILNDTLVETSGTEISIPYNDIYIPSKNIDLPLQSEA